MIIRNEIRNKISARPFIFLKSNGNIKSEEDVDDGVGRPSTGEGLVKIGSEVGTFGR